MTNALTTRNSARWARRSPLLPLENVNAESDTLPERIIGSGLVLHSKKVKWSERLHLSLSSEKCKTAFTQRIFHYIPKLLSSEISKEWKLNIVCFLKIKRTFRTNFYSTFAKAPAHVTNNFPLLLINLVYKFAITELFLDRRREICVTILLFLKSNRNA